MKGSTLTGKAKQENINIAQILILISICIFHFFRLSLTSLTVLSSAQCSRQETGLECLYHLLLLADLLHFVGKAREAESMGGRGGVDGGKSESSEGITKGKRKENGEAVTKW